MSIETVSLSYTYNQGSPFEVRALDRVSVKIGDGEFVALIGPTGSGKSTLVQHFNGLIKPQSGKVLVDGMDLSDRRTNLRQIRRRVGLVFQYPEYQLFEETVLSDVAFGPKNLGHDESESRELAAAALRAVGLDESIFERSPFDLSGGQMRRVAIAGVLAMGPGTFVLDEPTAGLDPRGRGDLLKHIVKLREAKNITVVLVSHSMEDVAKVAERVMVINRGRIEMDGPTKDIFSRVDELEGMGLGVPQVTKLMRVLKQAGKQVREDVLTIDEAASEIARACLGAGSRARV
jgi:energy-coupling factor transport system ATP-binding protein